MLYEEKLTAAIKAYKDLHIPHLETKHPLQGAEKQLDGYAQIVALHKKGDPKAPEVRASDVGVINQLYAQYERLYNDIKALQIPPMQFDAISEINSFYADKAKSVDDQRKRIEYEGQQAKSAREAEHEQEIQKVAEYNESLLVPLREQHQQLLDYKDDLVHVFERYEVSPLDCEIDENMSAEDFMVSIQGAIAVCQKYIKRDSKNLFAKLISPLKGNKNLMYTAGYTFLGLVLIYLFLPIIAIPVFVVFWVSVYNMYNDIENLKLASALMAGINYAKFIPEEEFKSVDDVDMSDIDADVDAKLAQLDNVEAEKSKALSDLSKDTGVIKACQKATDEVAAVHKEILQRAESLYKYATEVRDGLLPLYKAFPSVQNTSVVMSHNYILSRALSGEDVATQMPITNYVFDNRDIEWCYKILKLFLANILLSVRAKNLTIEIYDPHSQGSRFVEFLSPEASEYIKVLTDGLPDVLKRYRTATKENIEQLRSVPIDEFNMAAEQAGKVERTYKLLILASGIENIAKPEKKQPSSSSEQEESAEIKMFNENFTYTSKYGVIIWLLDYRERPQSTFVTKDFIKGNVPIDYTSELGEKAINVYLESLKSFKPAGLAYEGYIDKYLPYDEWWTGNSIKRIELHPGLRDGDPDKGKWRSDAGMEMFCDSCVHGLLAGTTGAGKSVTINQALMTLCAMYPPSELRVAFVDFKNVEASKFARGYNSDTGHWNSAEEDVNQLKTGEFFRRVCRIPHMILLAGTTDGEYALSVFQYLNNEMIRRQKINNKFGKTKIEEVRNSILSDYNKTHGLPKDSPWSVMRKDWDWYTKNVIEPCGGDLPRLVFIFDEFQVMFNPEVVDPRTVNTITGLITNITKLARAMSVHLWFTSQSMKGTLSADILANFSLRMCLRATDAISQEVLGNPASGRISAKVGFMYSNTETSHAEKYNKYWRIPYFPKDEDLYPQIDKLYPLLDKYHEQHNYAELYDEKQRVPDSVLHEWYDKRPETKENPRLFIFGEATAFSEDKSPVNVVVQDDDGENFVLTAFDRIDLMDLTMTMIDNVRIHQPKAKLLINCADNDMYITMGIQDLTDPMFVDLASPKTSILDLVAALTATILARKERVDAGDAVDPLYVVCMAWEKVQGIGVDAPRDNRELGQLLGNFMNILRDGPAVGVHFILALRELGTMGRQPLGYCKHRIGCYQQDKVAGFVFNNCSGKVAKLPTATEDKGIFALYEYGPEPVKFRVYQHTWANEVPSRSVKF